MSTNDNEVLAQHAAAMEFHERLADLMCEFTKQGEITPKDMIAELQIMQFKIQYHACHKASEDLRKLRKEQNEASA